MSPSEYMRAEYPLLLCESYFDAVDNCARVCITWGSHFAVGLGCDPMDALRHALAIYHGIRDLGGSSLLAHWQ